MHFAQSGSDRPHQIVAGEKGKKHHHAQDDLGAEVVIRHAVSNPEAPYSTRPGHRWSR